ncbi:MAG: hypothetical protein NTW16_05475 [Bacteroidetes bacterium]|nr:hypothetical protein [Bacteroidota bacterium]
MITPKIKAFSIWLLIFALVWGMAYIRPIHQDDGWYATYAFRLIQKLSPNEAMSYWSFQDANGSDLSVGFLFSSLQVPFYLVFGISVFSARLFNALVLTLLVYLFYLIVKLITPKIRWLMVVLLLVNQVFYYHFYNRPEILGMVLVLLSIYLLFTPIPDKRSTFIAFLIWGLILDAHPIAIFSILGLGLWYLFMYRHQIPWALIGGGAGIGICLTGNYLVNANFGLFNGIMGGEGIGVGDHYIPILTSDLVDFVRIFKTRFQNFQFIFLLSGIWIIIPFLAWKRRQLNLYTKAIGFNFLVFFLLSTLFTEATGNGWALYNLMVFFMLLAALLNEVHQSLYIDHPKLVFLLMIPLFLFTSAATIRRLFYNYPKSAISRNNFSAVDWNACLPNGTKVLMRPTFSFATVYKHLWADYPFGILNVMRDNNISFKDAILLRNYDYLVLDERNLNVELLKDIRPRWTQPYYRDYNDLGLSKADFQKLISVGFLQITCRFNEPMHGNTIIFKVNKSIR